MIEKYRYSEKKSLILYNFRYFFKQVLLKKILDTYYLYFFNNTWKKFFYDYNIYKMNILHLF